MSDAITTGIENQPHSIIERDGVRYTLLGTAHVSHDSVNAVKAAIASEEYDVIAVELDAQRMQAMSDPEALAKLDLIKVIKEKKIALFAANLGLAAYQRRLAEQLGIEPGAELKAAVEGAKATNRPVHLIDRDVGITFKRISQKLGFFGKMKLASSLITGLFIGEEVAEEDIEKLKQGDMLESSFGEFAKENPDLFASLIDERDQYMAAALRAITYDTKTVSTAPVNVLAVVGAGHLNGLARYLQHESAEPETIKQSLIQVKKKCNIPWITMIITTLIIGGIIWVYWNGGFEFGTELLKRWVLFTAGFTALGCLLAGGHPLSILVGAIASPLKPFRPGIPPGMLSALVEAQFRKPVYQDFLDLRDDAQTYKGWYKNRVSRIVLVFILTNLGSSIGVWLAGFSILKKFL